MDKLLYEIEGSFKSNKFIKSDIVNIMINFRLFLEKNKIQSQYKYLNLYCNWVVHNEISQSQIAFNILDLLTDSMIAHNSGNENFKWINDCIIEGLGFHNVQSEIIEIGERFSADFKIIENNMFWKIFGATLLNILMDRPIVFPENITNRRTKNIYESICKKAKESGSLVNGVISIKFVEYDKKICWSIETLETKNRNINIIGPMSIITKEIIY